MTDPNPLQQLAGFIGSIVEMLAHYAAYEKEMYESIEREVCESLAREISHPFAGLCRFCGEEIHSWPC